MIGQWVGCLPCMQLTWMEFDPQHQDPPPGVILEHRNMPGATPGMAPKPRKVELGLGLDFSCSAPANKPLGRADP